MQGADCLAASEDTLAPFNNITVELHHAKHLPRVPNKTVTLPEAEAFTNMSPLKLEE